jgi:hypothetical protein
MNVERNITFKALLISNNAPGHTLGSFFENVKIFFRHQTSLLQLMDQGAIETFKACYIIKTFEQAIAKTT